MLKPRIIAVLLSCCIATVITEYCKAPNGADGRSNGEAGEAGQAGSAGCDGGDGGHGFPGTGSAAGDTLDQCTVLYSGRIGPREASRNSPSFSSY